MGFLEKMRLIEKVPETTGDVLEDSFNDYEDYPAVEYDEGCEADALIEDVYTQNDLYDKARSIFKVEELMDSLPKEMLTETKRSSVLSILKSFGLATDEVITDGEKRVQVLNAVKERLNIDGEEAISHMKNEIEEHKKEIASLDAKISGALENTKKSNEAIDIELEKIASLIEFIGGIK